MKCSEPRGRSTLLRPRSMLAVLVSCCWLACGGNDAPSAPSTPSRLPSNTDVIAEQTFSFQAAATDQSVLSVRGINGSIAITGGPGNGSVTISAVRRVGSDNLSDAQSRLAGLQVQVTTVGSEIRVETSQPADNEGRSYVVNYEIAVPTGVDVSVRSTNGDVGFTDTSGNVLVELTNGTIRSQLTLPRDGALEQSTVNGNVELSLPSGTNAELSANVTNGTITLSGLDLQDEVATGNSITGRLGNGRGTIALRTVNGNITVGAF